MEQFKGVLGVSQESNSLFFYRYVTPCIEPSSSWQISKKRPFEEDQDSVSTFSGFSNIEQPKAKRRDTEILVKAKSYKKPIPDPTADLKSMMSTVLAKVLEMEKTVADNQKKNEETFQSLREPIVQVHQEDEYEDVEGFEEDYNDEADDNYDVIDETTNFDLPLEPYMERDKIPEEETFAEEIEDPFEENNVFEFEYEDTQKSKSKVNLSTSWKAFRSLLTIVDRDEKTKLCDKDPKEDISAPQLQVPDKVADLLHTALEMPREAYLNKEGYEKKFCIYKPALNTDPIIPFSLKYPELKGFFQSQQLPKEISQIIPFAQDAKGTLPGLDVSLDALLRKTLKEQVTLDETFRVLMIAVLKICMPVQNKTILLNLSQLGGALIENSIYRIATMIGMTRFKLRKMVMKDCESGYKFNLQKSGLICTNLYSEQNLDIILKNLSGQSFRLHSQKFRGTRAGYRRSFRSSFGNRGQRTEGFKNFSEKQQYKTGSQRRGFRGRSSQRYGNRKQAAGPKKEANKSKAAK